MNKKRKQAMIAYGIKIAGLEEIAQRQAIMYDAFAKRLAEHDESFEAMDEGLNKLTEGINGLTASVNAAGQDLLQRVKVLEGNATQTWARSTTAHSLVELHNCRSCNLNYDKHCKKCMWGDVDKDGKCKNPHCGVKKE